MSNDVLVKVDNVSKRFCRSLKRSLWYGLQDLGSELGGHLHGGGGGLAQRSEDVELRKDEFWAVKDVSFDLRRGECIGIVGKNGAGKSTLLRLLNGLIKPDTGRIQTAGNIGSIISLGAGLNPILNGIENIKIALAIYGIKAPTKAQIDEIIEFSELEEFIYTPCQSYSSGMLVRLGFAIATSFERDIIFLDEVLAVGDQRFKAKCRQRIHNLIKNSAVVLVSHSEENLHLLCNRGILMDKGQQHCLGSIGNILSLYRELFAASVEFNSSLILCADIEDFRIHDCNDLEISPGSTLSLNIDVMCKCKLKADYIKIQLESDLSERAMISIFNQELDLNIGLNCISLRIPNLHLRSGEYILSLILSSDGGKFSLVQAKQCASLRVLSQAISLDKSLYSYTCYTPPLQVHLNN